jgi:hypothetical protein
MAIAFGGESIGAAFTFACATFLKPPVANDAFCLAAGYSAAITILELVAGLMPVPTATVVRS